MSNSDSKYHPTRARKDQVSLLEGKELVLCLWWQKSSQKLTKTKETVQEKVSGLEDRDSIVLDGLWYCRKCSKSVLH